MTTKISNFDISEYLEDEESIAAYLSAVLDEGDPKLLLAAIGDIAKARGMAKIASESGLGRESLYKALNPEAKPRFETVMKVLNALGVQIGIKADKEKKRTMQPQKPSVTKNNTKSKRKNPSRPGSGATKRAGFKKKA